MKFNILIGGKAGLGPNILAEVISEGLIDKGFYVFYSRDYQSLIRGGHNFNVLSFSDEPIHSNSSELDMLICLDDNTEKVHKKEVKKNGIILSGEENHNMYFAGVVYKIFDMDLRSLEKHLKDLKNFDENMREARKGYNNETRKIELPQTTLKKINFMNGNKGISVSAIKSGLEYYYAYPMTPATPVMMELGMMQLRKENNHKVIELENEIAVLNAALGSALVGARAMVGTSGGGFDLMTEALSLSGMAEIPVVIYLASRPGPATGVATYTGQGDFNMSLYAGHGEFNRVVIAPGDPVECEEATNQAFYLSQKFRMPVIVLGDKHLAESKYSLELEPKFVQITNSITELERFNSYEIDRNQFNTATEDAGIIKDNFDRRGKISKEVQKEASKFEMFKVFGNKNSKNVILSWGSPKGAILDAISDRKIDAKFIQILYLEPFSEKIKLELAKAGKILIIENNGSGNLSQLLTQKTGIFIDEKNKILRYDGRPFLSDELAEEILKRLK